MKKTIIILFALALGMASCSNNCANSSAQKEEVKPETTSISYDSYTNPRFGFSIMYPTFLTPQPESENGDGRVFSNGNEEMSVYASNNVLDQSIEDLFQACQNSVNGTVTEFTQKDNWFEVSGTNSENNVFYRKTILKDDVEYTVSVTYPKDKKQVYDEILKKITESFKVGLEVTIQEN